MMNITQPLYIVPVTVFFGTEVLCTKDCSDVFCTEVLCTKDCVLFFIIIDFLHMHG